MSRICSEMLTKSRRLAERGREGMETIRNTKYLFTCWCIFFLLFVSVSLSELLKADSHRKREVWRNLAIIKTILSRMSSLKSTQVSFNEVVKTVMRRSLKPGQYKVVKKLLEVEIIVNEKIISHLKNLSVYQKTTSMTVKFITSQIDLRPISINQTWMRKLCAWGADKFHSNARLAIDLLQHKSTSIVCDVPMIWPHTRIYYSIVLVVVFDKKGRKITFTALVIQRLASPWLDEWLVVWIEKE